MFVNVEGFVYDSVESDNDEVEEDNENDNSHDNVQNM